MTAVGILAMLCCASLLAVAFYACMWIRTVRDLTEAEKERDALWDALYLTDHLEWKP